MRKLLLFPIFLSLFLWSTSSVTIRAHAAESNITIVASVNDMPITSFELEQRINLARFAYEQSHDNASTESLRQEAFEALITERLIQAEAKKAGVAVDKEELRKGMNELLKQDRVTQEELTATLEKHHIEFKTLEEKIANQILWQKFLMQKIAPSVKVSDEEVYQTRTRMLHAKEKDVYTLIHIIFQLGSDPSDTLSIMKREQDVERFKKGFTQCQGIPQQLAQIQDVQVGPPVRLPLRHMDQNVSRAVEGIKEPTVTSPIRTQQGFELLAVCSYNAEMPLYSPEETQFDAVREQLILKRIQEMGDRYLSLMRQNSRICSYDKDLSPHLR